MIKKSLFVKFPTYLSPMGMTRVLSHPFDERIEHVKKLATVAPKSLSAIIDRLAKRKQPVTCIIHAFFFPWMVDLGSTYGVPSIQFIGSSQP
jgi:hypothetical protein